MGKQEKRVLTLDRYEHGVVVNALKVIDAPAKKVRCRNDEERE